MTLYDIICQLIELLNESFSLFPHIQHVYFNQFVVIKIVETIYSIPKHSFYLTDRPEPNDLVNPKRFNYLLVLRMNLK